MAVKISPIKILSDLGFEMVDIETDEDYLSALKEGINTIEASTRGSGDRRSEALREELIRIRRERKENSKLKIKKTTVDPQRIMGQKILPPARLDPRKLAPQGGDTNALSQILVGVTSIRDILINQIKQKRDDAKKKLRITENVKRKEKESGLEILKKGFSAVKKGAEKVIKPVRNLFKDVFDFIGKIIFGRVVFKLLEWFSDKKNQDKVKAIGKFLKKTWPVLLAAYLLFGNAFGRMTVKLGVMITRFTFKLMSKIIPALVRAIAKMKVGKWLKRIPGLSAGGLLPKLSEGGRGGPSASEGIIQGPQSGFPVSLDGGKSTAFEGHGTEEVRKKGNDSFVIPIDTPDTRKNPFLTEQRTDEANKLGFPPSGESKKPMSMEDLVAAAGPSLMQWMADHNALIDSDPDALFGEHMRVEMDRDGNMPNFGKTIANMSEWAFNTGVEQLANNEAIDPDVKEALLKKMAWIRKETLENPNFKSDMAFRINKDIPGTAANRLYLRAQNDPNNIAIKAGISPEEVAKLWNRRGMSGGGLVQAFQGGRQLIQGLKGGGQVQGGRGRLKDRPEVQALRKNAANIQPKKTVKNITPSRRKKTTVAYQDQGGSMKSAGGTGSSGNKEIPSFSATAMRSSDKIDVLGISV